MTEIFYLQSQEFMAIVFELIQLEEVDNNSLPFDQFTDCLYHYTTDTFVATWIVGGLKSF